jgi:hypothetical protein
MHETYLHFVLLKLIRSMCTSAVPLNKKVLYNKKQAFKYTTCNVPISIPQKSEKRFNFIKNSHVTLSRYKRRGKNSYIMKTMQTLALTV